MVDFETTGLNVLAADFRIVGVGIACRQYPDGIYTPIDLSDDSYALIELLSEFPLIAHNVGFDAKAMERHLRNKSSYSPMSRFPWISDTYFQYKILSSEGYPNQGWSLKDAQCNVLSWPETNEVELDQWLIDNGHTKSKNKPDKGLMYLAPDAILGKYCALDAQSTWALHEYFSTYYDEFPDIEDIIGAELMALAELEMEEFFRGMYVDESLLDERIEQVELLIGELESKFIEDSAATPFIVSYNDMKVQEIVNSEPAQYTKTGKVTARYPKWQAKVEAARNTNYFNMNSKHQLCWLFYDCLYKTSEVMSKVDWRGNTKYQFYINIDGNVLTLNGTATGRRAIDKKVLPKLGEVGILLTRYNELIKLLGYMTAMRDSLRNSTHHTQLKLFGTLTSRCSGGGGGINIQQIPKVREYLDCLKPRPGHAFIQMDIDALEPVVLAELSQDSSMMKLYGPSAKPNDIYLFIGAYFEAFRDEICRYGYDPMNPTPEAISITKKKAKRLRGICKVLHLSAGYGASASTIWKNLVQSGIQITLEEVEKMYAAYWELFGGVITYKEKLTAEWKVNGGWFLNGRGIPMPVSEDLEKDILNRDIQSTGHINLLTYLKNLQIVRRANPSIQMFPVVVDFHDETVWEVPTEQADAAKELFKQAWVLTNEELGGIIPLSGDPEICYDFSYFKCDGGYLVDDIRKQFNLEVA